MPRRIVSRVETQLTLLRTTSFAARFSGSILSSWPFQYVILIPLLGARMSMPVRFTRGSA